MFPVQKIVLPDNAILCVALNILFHLNGILRFCAQRAVNNVLAVVPLEELFHPKPRVPTVLSPAPDKPPETELSNGLRLLGVFTHAIPVKSNTFVKLYM